MFDFSKYDNTKKYWKLRHKSNNYAKAENIEKNNKISREFIQKYIKKISDIDSLQELGVGSGRNLNIFIKFFPNIKYFGNDISQNLITYVEELYPQVSKLTVLTIKDTLSYLDKSEPVDLTFTHGHLMHLPNDIIEEVIKKISLKTKKFILIREAYINNPGVSLLRKWRYKKYRFDRDYSNQFLGFKLVEKKITEHPTKKWVRQGEYFFEKIKV